MIKDFHTKSPLSCPERLIGKPKSNGCANMKSSGPIYSPMKLYVSRMVYTLRITQSQHADGLNVGSAAELQTNTGRQRLNLSGAIDIISKRVFVREDETLNSASTIAFLKDVEAAYPQARKVHVFCDNAKYYRKDVQAYIKTSKLEMYRNKDVQAYIKTSKLEMHFLPPYSPNLNPIERLWKFMNEHVLYNKYYRNFDDFRRAVLGFLQNLFSPSKEWKEALDRRITENFHIFGACQRAF